GGLLWGFSVVLGVGSVFSVAVVENFLGGCVTPPLGIGRRLFGTAAEEYVVLNLEPTHCIVEKIQFLVDRHPASWRWISGGIYHRVWQARFSNVPQILLEVHARTVATLDGNSEPQICI